MSSTVIPGSFKKNGKDPREWQKKEDGDFTMVIYEVKITSL